MEIDSKNKGRKPNKYWNKDKCKEAALRYEHSSDFKRDYPSAYHKCAQNGWLKEIGSHFIPKGNRYKRFIYAYEFSDNTVYVGLTYNIEKRNISHNKSGSVFEHILSTGCKYNFVIHTPTPVKPEEAQILEEYYLKYYIDRGWTPLNKSKTGSIGCGIVKWSFEDCFKEALKFQSRQDFCNQSGSAYAASLRNNWIEDVCSHMVLLKKPAGFYKIKENCIEEALKYESITQLQNGCSAAYKSITKNNWNIEAFNHMKIKKQPDGYYTIEKCIDIAKSCTDLKEMKLKYCTAIRKIWVNKWMDQIKEIFKNKE